MLTTTSGIDPGGGPTDEPAMRRRGLAWHVRRLFAAAIGVGAESKNAVR